MARALFQIHFTFIVTHLAATLPHTHDLSRLQAHAINMNAFERLWMMQMMYDMPIGRVQCIYKYTCIVHTILYVNEHDEDLKRILI